MVGQPSPIRNWETWTLTIYFPNIVASEPKIESPTTKLVSGPTLIFKPFARGFKGRLVWPVPLAQVLPRSQLIFPSKTWFLEFI
jgi:hypothetical protein